MKAPFHCQANSKSKMSVNRKSQNTNFIQNGGKRKWLLDQMASSLTPTYKGKKKLSGKAERKLQDKEKAMIKRLKGW